MSANPEAASESEHNSGSSFDSSESESGKEDSDLDDANTEGDNDGKKIDRGQTFKEWALKQMNKDIEPVSDISTSQVPVRYEKPKGPARALAGKVEMPSNSIFQDSKDSNILRTVKINRSDELQTSRLLLPVTELEQEIVETVLLNPITVICGETGSGKTTQLPQFLYERGFGSKGSCKGYHICNNAN